MRRWAPLLAFLLVGAFVSAQENCYNAIDDDGDGLVDLNDTADCSCALPASIPSLLPNPSLEQFDPTQSGCASVQPGGLPDGTNQANCLTGWQRASLGTTDAWNAFTFTGAGPYFPVTLPQPLPSGSGVAGFWVGIRDEYGQEFVNNNGSTTTQYREYLAACFVDGQRLRTGTAYRLDFQLGFMEPQQTAEPEGTLDIRSPETVELAVYGIRRCDQLNFGGFYSCPETSGAEGYELITTIMIEGGAGQWTPTSLNFVAAADYAALAIGGSCAEDARRADGGLYRNYYFIDELRLNTPEAFLTPVAGPVSVDGLTTCDDITLSGQPQAGATYQWYRNGVAIVGATTYILTLDGGPAVDGDYTLRVSTAAGCAVTEAVVIRRPVITDLFPDTIGICTVGDSVTIRPRRQGGATYRWSDGSAGTELRVGTPGTYSVTVTEACVEHTETITVAVDQPLRYTFTQLMEGCADTATVQLTTNAHHPKLFFRALPSEARLAHTDGLVRVPPGVAGVMAFIDNGCSLLLDTVWITAGSQPLALADPVIEPMDCATGRGSVTARVTTQADVQYRWMAPNGSRIGTDQATLTVYQAGEYTLEVSAPGYCTTRRSYTLSPATSFDATFTVSPGDCMQGGAVTLTSLTLSSDYQITWYQEDWVLAGSHDATSITDLESGSYRVEITAANGCTLERNFTIGGRNAVAATATPTFTRCDDPNGGRIDVVATGGAGGYTYSLSGHPDQLLPQFTGLAAGRYMLRVTDSLGCTTPPREVVLSAPGTPVIEVIGKVSLHAGDATTLQLVLPGGSDGTTGTISWSPAVGLSCTDCPSPAAAPAVTTTYTATYTTADGCTLSDRVTIVVGDPPLVYAPNVIRPGGTEPNEHFTLFLGEGAVAVTELQIYGRWGELIWVQTNSEAVGWDGTHRGKPLDPGVYVYVGKVLLASGRERTVKGSVTLLR